MALEFYSVKEMLYASGMPMAKREMGVLWQKIRLAHGSGLKIIQISADVSYQVGETDMSYNIGRQGDISFGRTFNGGFGNDS